MSRVESTAAVLARIRRISKTFRAPKASAPPRASVNLKAPLEDQLAILELLVTSHDLAECADRALEWLGKHAGIRKALCVIANPERDRITGLAGWGVSRGEIEGFSVTLEEREHPLVTALAKGRPLVLRGDFSNPSRNGRPGGISGQEGFAVIPLGDAGPGMQGTTVGLLLVSPASARRSADLIWLTDCLARMLTRRLGVRSLSEAEQGLRRERERLYNILNTVHDPIILTDTEGRLIISNKSAEFLFGSREEESEGRRRAVALNNMFLSAALSKHAIGESSPLGRELLLVDPVEGSDLFFEFSSTAFSDVHEGTGIVTILRNVNELRRTTEELEENYRKLRLAEAEVRSERDRLDLIIESVAEPILVTDPEGKILIMNEPAERLFTAPPGATPETTQVVRANDINFSSFVSSLFLMGESGKHTGGISLVDPEKGTPVPVEAVSAKVIAQQGELIGVATILHDRTEALEKARLFEELQQISQALEERVKEATGELVRQNEVLRRQHMELQRVSAAKSQFLASVSHELRTPLNSIIGYTRILLQGVSGGLNPQQLANLARLDANAGHLLSLINQLLDITRIEAGKMSVKLAKVSLATLISEVMSEIEPLILQSKLEVTTQVPADLPEVRSDAEKIKQIVLNLVMNALKFTPQGWVKVSAAYLPHKDQVAITVADSGIGIAESEREQIFEDFRRAVDSVAKGFAGVGLGLSICRRLSNLLGGGITVASRIGHGSSFTLTLPRQAKIQ